MKRWLVVLCWVALAHALACGKIPEGLWTKTWHYAQAWGVDPYLVAAVVWVESNYCPDAVSNKGAVGLGQFMPATWKEATGAPIEWRTHPDWALWATAKHLRYLWLVFRDWNKALMAYHAGVGAVKRGRVPAISVRYANKVLSRYRAWKYGRG